MKRRIGMWSVVCAAVVLAVGCCDGAEDRPDPDMGTWETGYSTAGDSSVDSVDPWTPDLKGYPAPAATPCSIPTDCKAVFPPCYVNACLNGICGSEILPNGSPCKFTPGSNVAAVCIQAVCVAY